MRYRLSCQGSLFLDRFLGISDGSLHNVVDARAKFLGGDHLQESTVALSGSSVISFRLYEYIRIKHL